MPFVNAYAVHAHSRALVPTRIQRRELGAHDVQIDIQYSGICHSDIHTVHGEWGEIPYPLVPGHEITGRVTAVGAFVTRYRIGDRVGVGCIVDSCRKCDPCLKGYEQYCVPGNVQAYAGVHFDGSISQGGYCTQTIINENYVLSMPDGLDSAAGAPLLCAGITVYSPLKHWGAGPGKRVAIIGMGGLGHLAVQIAHALGAEVTVLSQTLSKREDGLRLGADRYFATDDPQTFIDLQRSFDLVISTVSAELNLDRYLALLDVNGTLVNVGVPAEPLGVKAMSLVTGRRSLAGSSIGGIRETQEMLDFCSDHQILPEIELISAQQINEAFERVLASQVRYRFVIDAATFS